GISHPGRAQGARWGDEVSSQARGGAEAAARDPGASQGGLRPTGGSLAARSTARLCRGAAAHGAGRRSRAVRPPLAAGVRGRAHGGPCGPQRGTLGADAPGAVAADVPGSGRREGRGMTPAYPPRPPIGDRSSVPRGEGGAEREFLTRYGAWGLLLLVPVCFIA